MPLASAVPGSSNPHLRFLEIVRAHELRCALAHFPAPNAGKVVRVLEIGAGTGQQAKTMEDIGYRVTAIDLPSSYYRNSRVHDVINYDGRTIPVGDGEIDVVFSSNVLEHVDSIDSLLDETRRVLSSDGIAVHILPTSACRLWSIPAHYAWLGRRLYAQLFRLVSRENSRQSTESDAPRRPSSAREWIGTFIPFRHGERGSTVSEIFYFSRFWWLRKFRQHDFHVTRTTSSGIFYTMANVLGESFGMRARTRAARLLGSSCNIYVLAPITGRLSSRTEPAERTLTHTGTP